MNVVANKVASLGLALSLTASCNTPTASQQFVQTDARPVMSVAMAAEAANTSAPPKRQPPALPDTLTTLDLCDDWAPRVLTPPGHEPPAYREVFVALANEQFDTPGVPASAVDDRYFELFGVTPSPSVLLSRLADEDRHACHAAIDDGALLELEETLPIRSGKARDDHRLALLAAQAHLVCDGLLPPKRRDGAFNGATRAALKAYQRRHVLLGTGTLDADTRAAFVTDSRELDLRAALRMLRERVVDATGLLEDGTAAASPHPVLGRLLDPPALLKPRGRIPVAVAAPDRVGEATEAAALALGWTDADAIAQWLETPRTSCRVHVTLPEPPAWQRHPHELRIEIDRGDVSKYGGKVEHRPTLTVFVAYDGREEALVRWPTTIGGWNSEVAPSGRIVRRYKESPAGTFVWRDVVAAPTWLPPKSTPDEELLRQTDSGGWEIKNDTIGPGYRSAYGLAMMMHVKEIPARGDKPTSWYDDAVRTHGSANYRSVYDGTSHGCHRLPNHLAVRLASFVVRQEPHEVLGEMVARYSRDLLDGQLQISRDSRGFGYRLQRPVRVDVLEGRVLRSADRSRASQVTRALRIAVRRPSSRLSWSG